MKVILQDNNNFVISFAKGEEVFSGLGEFMKSQNIGACTFTGIGAISECELGYYNEHIKDYRKKPFFEELEIVSLIGNGGVKDGQPFIHAHGMFGRTDFTTIGGHVFRLLVSPSCEISLVKFSGEMKRELNSDLNLNLLT